MRYKKIKFILVAYLAVFIFFPVLAFASNPALDKLQDVGSGGKGPYETADNLSLSYNIGIIISAFLGLIGIIFIALLLYAGFHWMTARGEEEKVEKAKNTITRAVIGLIIVVGAYAIWTYVADILFK